jgi:ABC-type branched-subunit amino acid transport system permease subunit
VIDLAVFGVLVGLLFEQFGNLLARVPAPLQIVGTVGIMVAVQAVIVIKFGSAAVTFTDFLSPKTWQLGSTPLSATQVIVISLAVIFAVGLWALLRFTPFGTTTRAVVDAPELLALTGQSPGVVRRWSWVLGSAFAAASGILTAVVVGTLDPTILTLVLVQAFGAAAVGAFRSLGLSFVGGMGVGILAALTTHWVGSSPTLGGLPTSVPFLVLVVVLLVLPRNRLLVQRTLSSVSFRVSPARDPRPWPLRAGMLVIGTALVIFAPQLLGESRLPSLTETLVLAVLFLSLGVLVHLSGQVSLLQYGLAAVGATAFSHFAAGAGIPWLLALLLAGLVAVPVGALIAVPAIRLSGLFLALATFGFGLLLQQLFYLSSLMFGSGFDVAEPRPSWASTELQYYYVVAAIAAVSAIIVVWVTRSRLGRLLRGLAGSPTAMTTHGASLNVTKVLIFCISAFLAGIAGALMGPVTGSLNSTPFDPLNSLTLLTVLFLAGGGMVRYAFIGGIALALIPSYITNPLATDYLQVLFGVSAIAIACLAARPESGKSARTVLAGLLASARGRPGPAEPHPPSPVHADSVPGVVDQAGPKPAAPSKARP